MKSKAINITSNILNVKIFKDASYSERWPWVVKINGTVVNNGCDKEDAIDLAENWVKTFEITRITNEVKRTFSRAFKGMRGG
jgi:hypothetical protein